MSNIVTINSRKKIFDNILVITPFLCLYILYVISLIITAVYRWMLISWNTCFVKL